MFRAKSSVKLSYEWQGYIYFTCKLFNELPEERREDIIRLCIKSGGNHAEALFVYLTTDQTLSKVCMEHYLSKATLLRAVKRFYEGWREEGLCRRI